jgi:hypothetical protein
MASSRCEFSAGYVLQRILRGPMFEKISVPSSVKTKRQKLTLRNGSHAARRLHYLPSADMLLICFFSNSTGVFYLLCYCKEGSLKVTAAAEGLRGRKISLGRNSHLTFFILCCVLFLFPILLYFTVSLFVILNCLTTRKDMKEWWIWQVSKTRQRRSNFE